jgi:hypothetical protein
MTKVKSIAKLVLLVFFVLVLTQATHWGIAQLNVSFCQRTGFWGFVSSFTTTQSPVCLTLDSLYSITGNMYSILFGLITATLIPISSSILGSIYQRIATISNEKEEKKGEREEKKEKIVCL